MATFRGSVWGMRGTASRLGSAKSGLNGHLAGWQGGVRVHLWQDEDGRDCAEIVLEKGNAYGEEGPRTVLYAGPIDIEGRLAYVKGGEVRPSAKAKADALASIRKVLDEQEWGEDEQGYSACSAIDDILKQVEA